MIDKVFHVSDIHFRNYKRHKEYNKVLENLYQYIIENKTENSVIFLGGDIVHSKNDMSPELVDIVSKFFKRCVEIAPTILITGNHDLNLNNESRLDALSPIVDMIDNPNFHYWKDTGVYELNGVKFSVFSLIGDTNDWVKAKYIDGDYKIALHHGAVNNATTDLGHEIQNDLVKPSIFDGFDIVMLGDIHSFQILQQYSYEEKEIDEKELKEYLNKGWEIIND